MDFVRFGQEAPNALLQVAHFFNTTYRVFTAISVAAMKTSDPRSCVGPKSGKRAFTLIELLVVIAVIAILAALLLPTFGHSKERSKRVQCMGNQKQLALTWVMYATDNNDYLPSNGRNDPPSPSPRLWVQGAFVNPLASTTDEYIVDPKYAQFANYIKSTKTYVCAADRVMVQVSGVSYPKVRSYSLNAYLGWVGPWDSRLSPSSPSVSPNQVFTRHAQLTGRMPAGTFSFIDVNPDSICWPYFGVRMDADNFFNFPGSAHNQGCEISFSDGHVEYHRWTDKRTIIAYSADYHNHSDPSPGNRDIAWLRERTTVSK
jgi:prepilin-type N-terminal cleavage/methylation domain-containing protein